MVPISMRVLLFLFAFLSALSAADLTGKWTGSYDLTAPDGTAMKGKVIMMLTQTGNEVSGTIGTTEQEQTKITRGIVDGDRITFESQTEGPLMKFDLKLENEHIVGVAKGDADGNVITAKLDLART